MMYDMDYITLYNQINHCWFKLFSYDDDGYLQKLYKHSNCTKCKFFYHIVSYFYFSIKPKVADVPSNTCK